jgi:O-antigen ligase
MDQLAGVRRNMRLLRAGAALSDRQAVNLAIEQTFLLVLVVALPLFESPKWIALTGFLTAAAIRHATLGGMPRSLAPLWAALAVLMAAMISGLAAFAESGWGSLDPLSGAGEILLVLLTLLAALYGGYDIRFRRLALWATVSATAVAGAWTVWSHWGKPEPLSTMLSLGNVNTAALYVTLATTAMAALLADAVQRWSPSALPLVAMLAIGVITLIDLGSRTGMLSIVLGVGMVGLLCLGRWGPAALAGGLGLLSVGIWLRSPRLVEKFDSIELAGLAGLDAARAPIWEFGAEVFLRNPLIGVGWGNFRQVDRAALGFHVDPESILAHADHAHNQYLNILAEGGLIGFAAVAAFFGALVWRLWTIRPKRPAASPVWLAGVAALPAMLAGGLFEIFLVAEIALLLAILIGLAAAPPDADRQAAAPRRARPR